MVGPAHARLLGSMDRTLREAFPQVAADGGFDVVIGNPPYRRELNAKELFDRIAASPLGERWRQARMDLCIISCIAVSICCVPAGGWR